MGNRFNRYHPLITFFYYAGAIVLLFLMLHPIFLAVGFLCILVINFMHDRLQGIRRWFLLIIISVFFMMFLNPLFNERGRHILFEINHHRFTLEAVTYGGMNGLSLIGVIILFISYNIVMTPNKLLFLFSRFLPQFSVLLMLTLRFIPLMRRRIEEISYIQRSKGISVKAGKWKTKWKTAMLYVQVLLTFSLEEAIQTADSMKARGYGQGARTSYEYFRFKRSDTSAILYLAILFALVVTGRIYGYGYLTVYPLMEIWDLSLNDFRILICYFLFISFPILVEAGEKIRWRLSN